MERGDLIALKAIGTLLEYPRPEVRAALPEIVEVIAGSRLVRPKDRQGLIDLVEFIRAAEPLLAEERYVALFDRGRATSLHLFEHVHGEARDRGQAMVDLKAVYSAAGFNLTNRELPDYLPVVLEYLSCRDLAEAKAMLGDCAAILRRIGEALVARRSPYGAAFQVLLGIAGEADIEVRAAARAGIAEEDLDAEWVERPAFAPAELERGGKVS